MPTIHLLVLPVPGALRQPVMTVFEGDELTFSMATGSPSASVKVFEGKPGELGDSSNAFLSCEETLTDSFTVPACGSVTVKVAPEASIPEKEKREGKGGQFFTLECTIENETSTFEFMVNTFTLGKPPSVCEPRPVAPNEAAVNKGAYIYFNNEGDSVFCNVSLERVHSAALFGTTAFYVTGPNERGEDENDAHMLVQGDLNHFQEQTTYDLSLTASHRCFGAGSTIKITVGTSPGDEHDKRETLERP